MIARVKKTKFLLVADIQQAQPDVHHTPWGKVWTRGADVMATWRRYGFVPPSEYRTDYQFKLNREGGIVDHES